MMRFDDVIGDDCRSLNPTQSAALMLTHELLVKLIKRR